MNKINKSGDGKEGKKLTEYSLPKVGILKGGMFPGAIQRTANSMGAANVSMGPTFFYTPELTPESWLLPKSRQEVIKWNVPAGTLVHTNKGPLKIEDIVEGDEVLSSSGRWQKVTATCKKFYTAKDDAGNEWTSIKLQGLPSFDLGAYHPIAAIKRPQPTTGKNWKGPGQYIYKAKCKNIRAAVDSNVLTIPEIKVDKYLQTAFTDQELGLSDSLVQWVSPKKLQIGDFVVYPKFKYIDDKKEVIINDTVLPINKDACYFYGWFTAEGFSTISGNSNRISLTGNTDEKDTFIKLQAILKDNFNIDARVETVVHCKNAIRLYFSNIKFARIFKEIFGHGARNKQIPNFVLNSSPENVKAFLNGYFEGDGSFSKDTTRTSIITCATVSETLAHQLTLALSKINVWGNLEKFDTKNSEYTFKGKKLNVAPFVYQMHISGEMCNRLFDNYGKSDTKKRVIKYLEDDKNFYLPVREVNTYAKDAWGYDLRTEDHTYVVYGLVHNCRIFFNLEAYIQSILMMHARYPFSTFTLKCNNVAAQKIFNDAFFSFDFDWYDFLLQLSLSWWKFGEGVAWGNWNAEKKRWDSFICLDPDLVEIKQNPLSGKTSYELIPTVEIKKMVRDAIVNKNDSVPDVVINSVINNLPRKEG